MGTWRYFLAEGQTENLYTSKKQTHRDAPSNQPVVAGVSPQRNVGTLNFKSISHLASCVLALCQTLIREGGFVPHERLMDSPSLGLLAKTWGARTPERDDC